MSQARESRKELIKNIVRTNRVCTQAQLIKLLNDLGVDAKQAAVSRDMSDLKIRKDENGVYTLPEEFEQRATSEFIRAVIRASGVSLNYVMNQVVVRCGPGAAQSIAAYFDASFGDEVLGSIAGDDTILIICRDEDSAKEIVERVEAMKE